MGAGTDGFEGGIAHRLDVATSGQLLVAKTPEALSALRADFAQKNLRKHYRFLTTKEVPWKQHEISFSLAHHKSNRRKMVVQRGRQYASSRKMDVGGDQTFNTSNHKMGCICGKQPCEQA